MPPKKPTTAAQLRMVLADIIHDAGQLSHIAFKKKLSADIRMDKLSWQALREGWTDDDWCQLLVGNTNMPLQARDNIILLVAGYEVPTHEALVTFAQQHTDFMAAQDKENMFALSQLFLFHTQDVRVMKKAYVAARQAKNDKMADYIYTQKLRCHLNDEEYAELHLQVPLAAHQDIGDSSHMAVESLKKILPSDDSASDEEMPDVAAAAAAAPSKSEKAKKGTAKKEAAKQEPVPLQLTKEQCLAKLHAMIGLGSVKSRVDELVSWASLQVEIAARGLAQTSFTPHLVFNGAPGTGKTTVARLIGQLYRSLGLLKRGHFIEASRTELVGQYVGETTQKTNAMINDALDGVLFIDEAYSLTASKQGEKDPYGEECVSTLLNALENYRSRLVVIVAGYTAEMNVFLAANPGLHSRFPNVVDFENYTPAELIQVLKHFSADIKRQFNDAAAAKAERVLQDYHHRSHKRKDWANARSVRNFFDAIQRLQAKRLAPGGKILEGLKNEDFLLLLEDDIPNSFP